MKKFLLLFLISTALSCNGKPRIEFESYIYDFSEQKQNINVSHIFIFKNTGDGTLRIDKIAAG